MCLDSSPFLNFALATNPSQLFPFSPDRRRAITNLERVVARSGRLLSSRATALLRAAKGGARARA